MFSILRRTTRSRHAQPPRTLPVYVCCYHKVGTQLLRKVFRRTCEAFDWKFTTITGACPAIPTGYDVVMFAHSLVDLAALDRPYAAVHLIRDPRDVIVSGYLYHMRCREAWCTNTRVDLTPPIRFPVVPLSQEHRSETWKRSYVRTLNGRSYQENLKSLSQNEGILFEMDHYGKWTIEDMCSWNYDLPQVLEVRFEDVMSDFAPSFRAMFERLGLTEEQMEIALSIAEAEDLSKMSDKKIESDNHIASRNTSKWERYFTDELEAAFRGKFPRALDLLGYEGACLP